MDDIEHQMERGKKTNDTRNQLVDAETCCCGKIGLWKGIMILSTLTMIFSIIFMAFDSFIRGFTPWWVWGGTITGVVGGLLGCIGGIKRSWYKVTFAYLVWVICLTFWWFMFVLIEIVDMSKEKTDQKVGDFFWSAALFIWSAYTVYVINKYYRAIKPVGSKWNAFGTKKPGYNSIE